VAILVPLGVVIASWVVAMIVVAAVLGFQEPFGEHGLDLKLWTWIPAGDLTWTSASTWTPSPPCC